MIATEAYALANARLVSGPHFGWWDCFAHGGFITEEEYFQGGIEIAVPRSGAVCINRPANYGLGLILSF